MSLFDGELPGETKEPVAEDTAKPVEPAVPINNMLI